MYVWVSGEKYFYQSMVYCVIGPYQDEQYVVFDSDADRFELVAAKDENKAAKWANIQIIDEEEDEWVFYENAHLLKYKAYCKKHGKEMNVPWIRGYQDVCENYEFLSAILEKKSVPAGEAGITFRTRKDISEWKYIETQADADKFMKAFQGFHDSRLETMNYTERESSAEILTVFDNSEWYGVVELCFEGVQAVNIRPAKAGCLRVILSATLIVKDASVFWADDYMEEENLEHKGSWIKALSLKWRRIANE